MKSPIYLSLESFKDDELNKTFNKMPVEFKDRDQIVELQKGKSSVKIHLHGATVISWTVDNKNLLFISSKALMDGSKPIRGGIPLVFRKLFNEKFIFQCLNCICSSIWNRSYYGRTAWLCEKFEMESC